MTTSSRVAQHSRLHLEKALRWTVRTPDGCVNINSPWTGIDNDRGSSIRSIKLKAETPARQVVLATVADRYLSPALECSVLIVKHQYQTEIGYKRCGEHQSGY